MQYELITKISTKLYFLFGLQSKRSTTQLSAIRWMKRKLVWKRLHARSSQNTTKNKKFSQAVATLHYFKYAANPCDW